jgi:hypothetical protein
LPADVTGAELDRAVRGELASLASMNADIVARHLVMADCERGLGRPERAIEMAASPDVARLDAASKVELLIVVSGARRDMGQPDAAVLALQGTGLKPSQRKAWSARLFYAYADALDEAGRTDDALTWFEHAAAADTEGETDADVRIAELSGVTFLEADDGDEESDSD